VSGAGKSAVQNLQKEQTLCLRDMTPMKSPRPTEVGQYKTDAVSPAWDEENRWLPHLDGFVGEDTQSSHVPPCLSHVMLQ
jgi:hypothetical protein